MADYQTEALFGNADNTSVITADMMNPQAQNPYDWQTVLANGISGAAVSAINGMVGNAYASGQLKPMPGTPAYQQGNGMVLIIMAAVVFMLIEE